MTELSQAWQDWIAENKQRNVPDRALIDAMTQNGIDTQVAIKAVKGIQFSSNFQFIGGGTNVRTNADTSIDVDRDAKFQLLQKLESLIEIQNQLARLSPKSGSIERIDRISKDEFLEKYYSTNTPVIITGMMCDWAAMSQWCPEYLKAKYGKEIVEVQADRNSDRNYEINMQQHKRNIPFQQYLDMVVSGGETNDYYMVANNQTLERPEFQSLLNDIQMPDFLDSASAKQRVFFWVGPQGTITPLHHDPMNLIMAHIYGRKRWRLIDPKYTARIYNHVGVFSKIDLENPDDRKYPLFKDVPVIEEILNPGEIIFVPVGWWHQVKGLDVSIALSFTNFVFPNEYQFQNPNIAAWDDRNRSRVSFSQSN